MRSVALTIATGVIGVVWLSAPLAQAGRGCTLTGTPGADDLHGSEGRDVICAEGGDDTISGRDGRDIIYGGRGDDEIHGNRDHDTLKGGRGWDHLVGGDGIDSFAGHRGTDCFAAKDGLSELVRGGPRKDYAWADKGTPNGNPPDVLRSVEVSRACPSRPVE
jgi:hypothetical protein